MEFRVGGGDFVDWVDVIDGCLSGGDAEGGVGASEGDAEDTGEHLFGGFPVELGAGAEVALPGFRDAAGVEGDLNGDGRCWFVHILDDVRLSAIISYRQN